jgi:Zn-dependent protease
MWLSEITLQLIGFRLLALLLIVAVQGSVQAGTALLLGDPRPRHDGRLTLWPTAHLDLAGTVSMILFGLGWAKPVDVDARRLRHGRLGPIVVVLAGCLALLLLAAGLAALVVPALTALPHTAGLGTAAFLRQAANLAIWAALLSLVPVPPLAGGIVLDAFGLRLPRLGRQLALALVLLAAASGLVARALGPAQAALRAAIIGG